MSAVYCEQLGFVDIRREHSTLWSDHPRHVESHVAAPTANLQARHSRRDPHTPQRTERGGLHHTRQDPKAFSSFNTTADDVVGRRPHFVSFSGSRFVRFLGVTHEPCIIKAEGAWITRASAQLFSGIKDPLKASLQLCPSSNIMRGGPLCTVGSVWQRLESWTCKTGNPWSPAAREPARAYKTGEPVAPGETRQRKQSEIR